MQKYSKWIEEAKGAMFLSNKDLSLPKSADIELKPQVCNVKTDLTSENLVD